MNIWLILVAGGLVTYGCRTSFIAFGDRIVLPRAAERALGYVAPAAFAGISVPLILGGDGLGNFGDDLPRIAAALAAAGVVWWRRSLTQSLVIGMGTLWLLTWLS